MISNPETRSAAIRRSLLVALATAPLWVMLLPGSASAGPTNSCRVQAGVCCLCATASTPCKSTTGDGSDSCDGSSCGGYFCFNP